MNSTFRNQIIDALTGRGVTLPNDVTDSQLLRAIACGNFRHQNGNQNNSMPAKALGNDEDVPVAQPRPSLPSRDQQQGWNSLVQQEQTASGSDFLTAFNVCRNKYPDAFAALNQSRSGETEPTPLPPLNRSGVPQATDANISSLGLAHDADPGEFATAWKAAGNKPVADNPADVFDALTRLAVKNRGFSPADANAFVASRHKNLAQLVNKSKLSAELAAGQPALGAGFQKYLATPPAQQMSAGASDTAFNFLRK